MAALWRMNLGSVRYQVQRLIMGKRKGQTEAVILGIERMRWI